MSTQPRASFAPRARILFATFGAGLAVLIANCSFPDYFVPEGDNPDAPDDSAFAEGGPDSIPPGDSGPVVTCNDGGVKAGTAIACSCGATTDAAPVDADETGDAGDGGDAGVGGLRACTQAGTVGACIGCAGASPCEGASLPVDTTCVVGSVVKLGVANKNVCPPSGCVLEMPEHTVALTRFFLDDHEVTVRRFRAWWNAGKVVPKAGDTMFTAGDGTTITWKASWTVSEPTKADGSNDATWLGATVSTNDDAAINYVDWPTALAFCAAFGRRLPTEAEWEAAASGRQNRLFPFEAADTKGDKPTAAMLPCSKAISAASGASCGAPKGTATTMGFSIDNAYDLAGSVAEWTLDVAPAGGTTCSGNCYPTGPLADPVVWSDTNPLHAVRGGHYADTDPARLRAQARDFADLSTKSAKIGFRCATR